MATPIVKAADSALTAVVEAVKASKPLYSRRFGSKQIFLPNFTLTMIRNSTLPPTFASFIVPLNINKLDLRDYLWHAYGVPVIGVRSYIQQQKLRQDRPSATRVAPRRWYRPRAIKKMTVEMESPFVWPAVPNDEEMEKWSKKQFDAYQKDRAENEEQFQHDASQKPSKERDIMRKQAKEYMSGKANWTRRVEPQEGWEDVGEAEEVETEIELPESKPEK